MGSVRDFCARMGRFAMHSAPNAPDQAVFHVQPRIQLLAHQRVKKDPG